ncbi:MAG TPA: CRISPR system precrRNA processing endoribonuclease RAMP protein Cas6 [bacterium]|nr:CRISPR system precrRNA processing endoribonuclease RAMP protein Cas6 [bacterium]HQI47893.1 CRISPR system precrRNA processing endoribonuclease RAMP protein Cas6 [bacterium]HQJ66211.1 CRISPR system precrRNA processing endoribonuclease RAMP protein Cas6 [bacterium]
MSQSGFSATEKWTECVQLASVIFDFHLVAQTPLSLPEFKGSALRGGFGTVFKKVCCAFKNRLYCLDCSLNETCTYAYVFETPNTAKMEPGLTAQNLPHPFIIRPPLTPVLMLQPGDAFHFSLVLIGKGIDFFPFFVYAFEELGKTGLGKGQGRYILDSISGEEGQQVYSRSSRTLMRNFTVYNIADQAVQIKPSSHRLNLEFLTPTRITQKNDLTKNLSFELLMRNILRRGSLLARLHSDKEWELDYNTVFEKSRQIKVKYDGLRWYDWERYSRRQRQRMNLRGFTGGIAFEGELAPFLPFILLGSRINIGKNTSFGMGWYRILSDEPSLN